MQMMSSRGYPKDISSAALGRRRGSSIGLRQCFKQSRAYLFRRARTQAEWLRRMRIRALGGQEDKRNQKTLAVAGIREL